MLLRMLRAVSACLLLLGTALPLAAESAEHQLRVTTDSVAYCQELATRFADQGGSASEETRALAAEGVRLCGEGHPRTGIAKLRRALRATQPGGG